MECILVTDGSFIGVNQSLRPLRNRSPPPLRDGLSRISKPDRSELTPELSSSPKGGLRVGALGEMNIIGIIAGIIDNLILWNPRIRKYSRIKWSCRTLFLILKWTLHLMTGKSEIERLLLWGTHMSNLSPGQSGPRIKLLVRMDTILGESVALKDTWERVCKGNLGDEGVEMIVAKIGRIKRFQRGQLQRGHSQKETIAPRRLREILACIGHKYRLIAEIDRLKATAFSVSKHKQHLHHVWKALRRDGTLAAPAPPIPDEAWKELGFQGTDPGSDFRGTGLLGALQLYAFASGPPKHIDVWRQAQFGPYWYSFAIVSINVTQTTYNLVKSGRADGFIYTRMIPGSVSELATVLEPANELHAFIMNSFHQRWMRRKPENLFAFNSIYEATLFNCIKQLDIFGARLE